MTRYVASVKPAPGPWSRQQFVELRDTVTGDFVRVDDTTARSTHRRLELAKKIMVSKARDRAIRHMEGLKPIDREYDGCMDLDCIREKERA